MHGHSRIALEPVHKLFERAPLGEVLVFGHPDHFDVFVFFRDYSKVGRVAGTHFKKFSEALQLLR